MKKKRISFLKRGSYTIEAAAIMPVILLTIFGAVFICFYAHNKAKLTAAAYEAAVSGAMEGEMPASDPYETALYKSQELIRLGYLGLGGITEAVNVGDTVSVAYTGKTSDYNFFTVNIQASGEYRIWKPTKRVREIRFTESE